MPGEQHSLVVSVSNEGSRAIQDLVLVLRPTTPIEGLRVGTQESVPSPNSPARIRLFDDLSPDTTKEVTVPLRASSALFLPHYQEETSS